MSGKIKRLLKHFISLFLSQMLNFKKNPYSWNEVEDISTVVAGLSVNNVDGSIIPVKNLKDEIEVKLFVKIMHLNCYIISSLGECQI